MGAAWYVCVDRDDLKAEITVDGKALARAADQIDELCERLGLSPLADFMGMSSDDIKELIDDEIALPDRQREATWFDPEEGITYFNRLCEHIRSNPDAVEDAEAVLRDLKDVLRVLNQAKSVGARWHLAIDI